MYSRGSVALPFPTVLPCLFYRYTIPLYITFTHPYKIRVCTRCV